MHTKLAEIALISHYRAPSSPVASCFHLGSALNQEELANFKIGGMAAQQ
jgi:hypothetical protein